MPFNAGLANKIERLSVPIPEAGCWIWIGATYSTGYGQITFQGAHGSAHRASFEAFIGPIPDGLLVLHKCDTRPCVNPTHLYAGTYIDNRRDTLERSDWSHPYAQRDACASGHKYALGNYRIAKDGSRVCRECMKIYMRNYRSKK